MVCRAGNLSRACRGSNWRKKARSWAAEVGGLVLEVFFWSICSMHIIVYAYILCYTLPVKQKITGSALQNDFLKELLALWPALKGSLAMVRKPCIRPNCPACARGTKHPNYLLAFTQKGRRRCLYVPRSMVPVLKRALQNGRRIEQLLYDMGPRLLRDYRAQNPAQTGPSVGVRPKKKITKS